MINGRKIQTKETGEWLRGGHHRNDCTQLSDTTQFQHICALSCLLTPLKAKPTVGMRTPPIFLNTEKSACKGLGRVHAPIVALLSCLPTGRNNFLHHTQPGRCHRASSGQRDSMHLEMTSGMGGAQPRLRHTREKLCWLWGWQC